MCDYDEVRVEHAGLSGAPVQEVMRECLGKVTELKATVAQQAERICALEAEIAKLELESAAWRNTATVLEAREVAGERERRQIASIGLWMGPGRDSA